MDGPSLATSGTPPRGFSRNPSAASAGQGDFDVGVSRVARRSGAPFPPGPSGQPSWRFRPTLPARLDFHALCIYAVCMEETLDDLDRFPHPHLAVDINLLTLHEGALHALLLRSPHAHAKFTIDVSKARALPGVALILTAADIEDLGDLPCLFQLETDPFTAPPYPILAKDEVRHVGDAIAFVVAETVDRARDAIEAIEVNWTALPGTLLSDTPTQVTQYTTTGFLSCSARYNLAGFPWIRIRTTNPFTGTISVQQALTTALGDEVSFTTARIVDDSGQTGVGNKHSRPHAIQQFGLREGARTCLHKDGKERVRLR